MLKRAADGKPIGVEGEPRLIDCLAHPDDHPLVWRVKPCLCPPDEPHSCEDACDWGAIKRGPEGVEVDDSQCVGCQACVDACKLDNLKTRKDIIPVFRIFTNTTDRFMPWSHRLLPASLGLMSPWASCGQLLNAWALRACWKSLSLPTS